MSKKWWILIIIAIALILTVICQPQKIIIRIGVFSGSNWDVPSGNSYQIIDEAILRFEKEHPQVQVQYESGILKEDYSLWLSEQLLKGEEPDVFMILSEDFNTLSSLGSLMNLNSLMKDDQTFDSSQYYQSSLQSGIYQQKQFALPYESNPTLMFVNKTLLKKENIEIPDNNWTLSDFYKICQQVTKDGQYNDGVEQYGCYNYNWLDSIYSHGIQLFDDEGMECYLNQESVKDALNFVQKLNQLNQGHIVTAQEFDKGQVAFAPMTFAQYSTYKPYPWRVKKYSTFEWDCVKMPALSSQQKSSEVSSLLMGLSSRSSHTQEAWQFLKLLTYDEQCQQNIFRYSQGISSLKKVIQSSETISLLNEESLGDSQVDMTLLNEVMENTVHHNRFKKYESALNLIDTHIQQMNLNNDDLDISLMNLQKDINKYLKE